MKIRVIASATVFAVGLGFAAANANPAHHQGETASQGMGQMMSSGMMSGSMMGGGMMMSPDMMLVMLDSDGDGALSLAEFQGMHERMFAYMDANDDGKLEPSEFEAHHAGTMPQSDNDTSE